MRIFILEDDENRIKKFKEIFIQHNLTICINSQDAIEALKKKKFFICLLDHDLGGRQMVDSNEYDTGFRVAKEIPNTINKNAKIVVHSYNPTGAKNMVNVLDDAGCDVQYCPFGTFGEEILHGN